MWITKRGHIEKLQLATSTLNFKMCARVVAGKILSVFSRVGPFLFPSKMLPLIGKHSLSFSIFMKLPSESICCPFSPCYAFYTNIQPRNVSLSVLPLREHLPYSSKVTLYLRSSVCTELKQSLQEGVGGRSWDSRGKQKVICLRKQKYRWSLHSFIEAINNWDWQGRVRGSRPLELQRWDAQMGQNLEIWAGSSRVSVLLHLHPKWGGFFSDVAFL